MQAVEAVNDRVARAATVLEDAGISYAVIGGLAVAEWVGRVDKAAQRFTKDVDILLRRDSLDAAKAAMQPAGFIYGFSNGIDFFLDGPDGSPRDAVHVIFASEKVKPHDLAPTPDVSDWQPAENFRVIGLHELVNMKLTSYRRKDQVHIQDMIGVGLIDATWPAKFLPELGTRLQILLDDPTG